VRLQAYWRFLLSISIALLIFHYPLHNQQSGRLIATGNVEILEPSGNRIFAQQIDITDDFKDGFVSALNIETADNTRIAAESAERRDGEITTFNNGVYTACKACEQTLPLSASPVFLSHVLETMMNWASAIVRGISSTLLRTMT